MSSRRLQNYAHWWGPAVEEHSHPSVKATQQKWWKGQRVEERTIWGNWMSVRLLMRAWLRRASSFRRLSLCCSIILFSSSIVFRLHSIDEICFQIEEEEDGGQEKEEEEEEANSNLSLHVLHTQTSDWIFTCVWSCIMSASIFMLDSFRSLISWSRCLISSLFSTPVWSRACQFPLLNWKHPHFQYKFSTKLDIFVLLAGASLLPYRCWPSVW